MSRRVSAFALCIATAFCLSAGVALAGPAPMPSWSGLYVGGTLGYGSGTWSGDLTKYCPTPPGGCTTADFDFGGNTHASTSGNGWLGGAEVGIANQNNNFVWGLEGDISRSGVSGSGVFDTINFGNGSFLNPPAAQQVFEKHIQTNLDWLGTVRARFGVLVQPSTLLYGTGGLAVGGTSSHQDVYFNPGNAAPGLHASDSDSATKWGWTIGVGVEQRLDSHWSVKLEYLYADLGRIDYHYIGAYTGYPSYGNAPGDLHNSDGFSADLAVQVARIALNYKFN